MQPAGCDSLRAVAHETAEPDTTITREIDLDMGVEELWPLVGEGERWADWLVEAGVVDVVDGGQGEVVDDDGTERHVLVERVEPGRAVRFAWWPTDGPDLVSTVELVVVALPEGSRLRVTEVLASVAMASETQWDRRTLSLWCCVASLASV
ncbi:MAG: hypothetical protein JWL70_505 [Acidimicrobiia bacterium]|nr:hypothetical protein [Acidimicrobiia bacterium]